MDFDQIQPVPRRPVQPVRHAIAYGTNRQEMITRLVSPLTTPDRAR